MQSLLFLLVHDSLVVIICLQEFPVDLSEMHALIEIALERYDADKIGIPDYALESAGETFG